jgi:hypothetical protein
MAHLGKDRVSRNFLICDGDIWVGESWVDMPICLRSGEKVWLMVGEGRVEVGDEVNEWRIVSGMMSKLLDYKGSICWNLVE